MIAILVILAFVAAWNIAPMLMLCTLPIPWRHKLRGCKSFANAALRGLLVLPPDLLAPVVVPFALRQIGWGAESLPRWARWWDNDVSINGDHQVPATLADTPEAAQRATTRRPPPAQLPCPLGVAGPAQQGQCARRNAWPQAHARRSSGRGHLGRRNHRQDKEGWCVRRNGPLYQLYIIRKIGPLCLRVHYGHKLNHARIWGRPAMVVNISFSLVRWKGRHELHKKGRRRD